MGLVISSGRVSPARIAPQEELLDVALARVEGREGGVLHAEPIEVAGEPRPHAAGIENAGSLHVRRRGASGAPLVLPESPRPNPSDRPFPSVSRRPIRSGVVADHGPTAPRPHRSAPDRIGRPAVMYR